MFDDADVIYACSREDLINDGLLIDITHEAMGFFKYPVAITQAAYHKYIETDENLNAEGQTVSGRLQDLLSMMVFYGKRAKGSSIDFTVIFRIPEDVKLEENEVFSQDFGHTHRDVQLKSICAPGDRGEPVITILLPSED